MNDIQQQKAFRNLQKQNNSSFVAQKDKSQQSYIAPQQVQFIIIIFSKERFRQNQQIELVQKTNGLNKPFVGNQSTSSTIDQTKPSWALYLQECQSLLLHVDHSKQQMIINQNKRLTCAKIAEQKIYQTKIYDSAKQAAANIKKCQKIIQQIKNQGQRDSDQNRKICQNIASKLASDVQKATKQLRAQQKSFVDQRKTFQMTEKASFLQLAVDHVLNQGELYEREMMEEGMEDLEERSQQIKKIVQSIFQLNQIYKELGDLVVLQGSLLDRIDDNIEISKVNIAKGLQHLQSAQRHQKKASKCACIVTSVLMLAIVILFIILMKKWSNFI